MRILFSSDWHGRIPPIADIPKADVFVFSGDMCPNWSRNWRNDVDLQIAWIHDQVNPWLDEIPIKHKLCLFGNHDGAGTYYGIKKMINATVLHDEGITIDGINFWGSPHTICPSWYRYPDQWCFGCPNEERLKLAWDLIPTNTHVLVTHSPPYGYQDVDLFSRDQEHIGSKSLADKIPSLKDLKIHAFGHCHNITNPLNMGTDLVSVNAAERVIEVELNDAGLVIAAGILTVPL